MITEVKRKVHDWTGSCDALLISLKLVMQWNDEALIFTAIEISSALVR